MEINSEKDVLIATTKLIPYQPPFDTVNVYAHKIDNSGQILWDSSGVPICQKPFVFVDIVRPLLTSDMQGGAIITWIDYRKGAGVDVDCYAQRVYSDGNVGGDTMTSIRTYFPTDNTGIHIDSAYPNPFNNLVTFTFTINKPQDLEITVYNIQGQRIKTWATDRFQAGKHIIQWNGTNQTGKEVSSGIYFVRLTAGNRQYFQKMVLIR